MPYELVSLLLALVLGAIIGVGIGLRGGLRLAERRRAALGAHAQLSRLWPGTLPQRSAADILAGVIRVYLGGITYALPVLARKAAREWLLSLDARFAVLADDLEKAGNDTPTILTRLIAEGSGLLDMLYEYDAAAGGILPNRADIEDIATDTEILRAVLEVWRAVNPLADTLVGMGGQSEPPTDGMPPAPLTTRPRPTGGAPVISTASPTSSSSPTSTLRRTASSATPGPSSSGSSKPSASAPASSTTAAPTTAGAPASAPRRRSRAGTVQA